MKNLIFLFGLVIFFSCQKEEEEVSSHAFFTGEVIDIATNQPVSNVTLTFNKHKSKGTLFITSDKSPTGQTISNSEGKYELEVDVCDEANDVFYKVDEVDSPFEEFRSYRSTCDDSENFIYLFNERTYSITYNDPDPSTTEDVRYSIVVADFPVTFNHGISTLDSNSKITLPYGVDIKIEVYLNRELYRDEILPAASLSNTSEIIF